MQELAWERKNNKRLKGKAAGNSIVSLVFFLAALFFLIYPIVLFLVKGQLLTLPDGSFMPYFTMAAVVLTLLILCDNTGYWVLQRRLNTVLSIRNRNDALDNTPTAPTPLPAPAPASAPVSAPAPAPTPAKAETVAEEKSDSVFESLAPEEDSQEYPEY